MLYSTEAYNTCCLFFTLVAFFSQMDEILMKVGILEDTTRSNFKEEKVKSIVVDIRISLCIRGMQPAPLHHVARTVSFISGAVWFGKVHCGGCTVFPCVLEACNRHISATTPCSTVSFVAHAVSYHSFLVCNDA